ncbi:MAG: hypothetical protein ACE5GE_14845 [Phycisphaerae bacterium]
MDLTDEAKQRYLKGGGVRCPFCDGDQIEGGPVEIDEGQAIQPVGCLNCDRRWNDVYTLHDIEVREA